MPVSWKIHERVRYTILPASAESFFSEIYSPDHAHASWVQNREQLWNHAEAVEKRKDARLGREILFALPSELTEHQRKELIGTMAKSLVKRYGSVVDVAVHSPSRYGDERNFHAHVLLSSRRIGQDGFGEKVHELDDRNVALWKFPLSVPSGRGLPIRH